MCVIVTIFSTAFYFFQQLAALCRMIVDSPKLTGVPGGLVGGQRAYQDQCRGFKSHRVRMLVGAFLA